MNPIQYPIIVIMFYLRFIEISTDKTFVYPNSNMELE